MPILPSPALLRLLLPLVCFLLAFADTPALKTLNLADSLRWKRAASTRISNDGLWFAWVSVPGEGDAEVVLKNLKDGKEQRFPAGEAPRQTGGGPGFMAAPPRDIVFSEDSKWFAYQVNPSQEESKRLKKERKSPQRKVIAIELATGKKSEFEKVRSFAFSGEKSTHLAIHRTGADAPPAAPSPSATPPPAGAAAAPSNRPQGSDLILRELATGADLNFGNVSEFAFDKQGRWLAFIIDAADQAGNGIQLRNMDSGAVLPVDSAKAWYRSLNWTEKGDAFAALRGTEDKTLEDRLYAVIGVKLGPTGVAEKTVFDTKEHEATFPKGLAVSGNRRPEWREDLSAFYFGIAEPRKKKDAPKEEAKKTEADKGDVKPEDAKKDDAKKDDVKKEDAKAAPPKKDDDIEKSDLVLWHWRDKRLPSMQQVQEPMDRNFSYLAIYHPAQKKFVRLADETLKSVNAGPRMKMVWGSDVRAYEWLGNLDGRRYSDIYSVNIETGERKQFLTKQRFTFGPSPDGTKFAYYNDGHFYVYDGATGKSSNVTAKAKTSFVNTEVDVNIEKPPARFLGWSEDSQTLLLNDMWDLWKVSIDGKAVNLTQNGRKEQIRYEMRYRLDPEEKGIDFAKPMYVSMYGEWTKKSGIGLIDAAKPELKPLIWEDSAIGVLMKAKNSETFLFTRSAPNTYPDYWMTAKADLSGASKVSETNPQQKDFAWTPGRKLIDYTSTKGDKLQATLLLPAGYEPGKSYPTVVLIYEKMSRFGAGYPTPGDNGLSPAMYTSQGYAVLFPDIVYKVNDPGMSAVWCVVPAVEAAVKAGYVDAAKVGLTGHSWGGYQTAFLVTQTKTFKAAVAGAPLTDMISMYSSIYWNSGSANQPIFESSQGRFTGGYWEQTEAYIRNSPVYHAKNVETPLMILHNYKDGAVDFTQGIEYFNTLRRLSKPVVMLQYKGENHGLVKPANRRDYTVRMKEFFDYHLKGAPSPQWMEEGVEHLKLPDHLEQRARELSEALKPPPAKKEAAPPKKEASVTSPGGL